MPYFHVRIYLTNTNVRGFSVECNLTNANVSCFSEIWQKQKSGCSFQLQVIGDSKLLAYDPLCVHTCWMEMFWAGLSNIIKKKEMKKNMQPDSCLWSWMGWPMYQTWKNVSWAICQGNDNWNLRMMRKRIRKRPLSLHPQRHFLPPSVSPFVHFLPTPENSHLPTVATLKVHLWTLVLKILFCTWWEIKREVKNVFCVWKKAQGWLKTGFQTDRKGDRSHPSSQPEKKLLIIFMCSDQNWPMIISEHRKVLHIWLHLGNLSIHPTWCCSAYIRRWIISCCMASFHQGQGNSD